MKFDGIILDVDGTIWNTTGVVADAWNKTIDDLFPQVPHVTAQILQGQFGKTMDVIADNLFPMLSENEKKILMSKCCENEHKAIYHNTKNITYDGVIQTIKNLSKRIPTYIVSNCQKGYIELVMEKNNITKYIKDFECFGNNGFPKAKNISFIAERNGLKNPLYVGDTQGDYEACQEANVPFVWASYGFGKPADNKYFAKIDTFSQVEDLV